MSRTVVTDYHYSCDKCNAVKTVDEDDLPYGWETNEDGDEICDDCVINKELCLNFDESLFD